MSDKIVGKRTNLLFYQPQHVFQPWALTKWPHLLWRSEPCVSSLSTSYKRNSCGWFPRPWWICWWRKTSDWWCVFKERGLTGFHTTYTSSLIKRRTRWVQDKKTRIHTDTNSVYLFSYWIFSFDQLIFDYILNTIKLALYRENVKYNPNARVWHTDTIKLVFLLILNLNKTL